MPMTYAALDATGRQAYDATVRTTHSRMVELEVWRRADHKPVASLTNKFMGGSTQGDEDRVPVQVTECQLLDEDYVLDWSNGEHRHFDIQILDYRYVPALGDWVEKPSFRGPIWSFSRQGPVVSLNAEGSEKNAQGSIRKVDWWPAKTRATVVLTAFLRLAGARGVDLLVPSLKQTLPRRVTVGVKIGKPPKGDKKDTRRVTQRLKVDREDTYWQQALQIAQALGRDLYADARGRFILARRSQRPTITLTDRDILGPVTQEASTSDEVPNTFIVSGPNPKGPKGPAGARVELPKRHPSSAHALRWNGTPRAVIELIQNKHVRTDKAARRLGEQHRDRNARELVTHQVDAIPTEASIRPGTSASLPTPTGRVTAQVRQWTIPYGPGADPMTLGAARRRKVR